MLRRAEWALSAACPGWGDVSLVWVWPTHTTELLAEFEENQQGWFVAFLPQQALWMWLLVVERMKEFVFCHLSWLRKMGPCQFSTIKNLSTEEIEDHQAVFQHAALWHMCCKTPWGPLSLLSYPQTHCSQGCCWPEHSELAFTNRICASKFIRSTEPHMGWYLWYFGLAVTRLYISNQPARSKGSQRCEPQEEEDCREHHPVLGKSYKAKPVADYCIQKNYYH